MKKLFLFFFVATTASCLFAKPILTENVATLGKLSSAAGLGISQRHDEFGSPGAKYETVAFPFWFKLGLTNRFDIGLQLLHITDTLEFKDGTYTGTVNGQISPEIKYAFNDNWATKFIWHAQKREDSTEALPIALGDDFELIIAYQTSTDWPLYINAGYDWRGKYSTRYGVEGKRSYRVKPGDIAEGKIALEIPVRWHLSVFNEWAYYYVSSQKQDGITLSNTSGQALDTVIGLCWTHAGWTLRGGTGFGLLEESHTSFDLTRGAGDVTYHASVEYRLKAKRPEQ